MSPASIRKYVTNLGRPVKQLALATFDAGALLAILWISFTLRLGEHFIPSGPQVMLMALAPVVALPVFASMGLYRSVIRFLPDRTVFTICWAVSLSTLLWLAVLFLAEVTRFSALPRSIPVVYWLLSMVVISSSRILARVLLGSGQRRAATRAVIIYGAGPTGQELATALKIQGENAVAAFIDDDATLHGRDVGGVRVFAPGSIGELVANSGATEIILSMPSTGALRRKEILRELSKHSVTIRTLPSISELATGKYLIGELREIDIDDLLGRSSVPADNGLLKSMIEDKVILVTGGGGSIGSELCRLVAMWAPRKLIIIEANEFALYQIDRQLRNSSNVVLVPVLGSVTDEALVRQTLRAHGVQVVFHAAAHKHVPLVEANALEGMRNNIFGTDTVTRAAFETGVPALVLISTDKAVRPTNVMGATKRWAEFIVGHYGALAKFSDSGQRFCAVRFGNVLGSNGSVVPLFKEQIAAGGPVTLTDERMTRYFMSIHEAAELIVQAGALSEGEDLFLLDMGEPVKILELAENMVQLAGLSIKDETTPHGDIEIAVTGLRPGEKLYEEMFYNPDSATVTSHPKILRATSGERADTEIVVALDKMRGALERRDETEARKILFDAIQE